MNLSSVLMDNNAKDRNSIAKVANEFTSLEVKNEAKSNNASMAGSSIMEDTEIEDTASNNNNNDIISSDTKVEENQTAMERLADLNQQKIKLFSDGIFDSNNERFTSIDHNTQLVEEHRKLIKNQIDALVTSKIDMLPGIDESSVASNRHAIPVKDVPIFNVDPSANVWDVGTDNHNDKELSLTVFLLKFERLFLVNGLDINKFWHYYLEIAFEGSLTHHTWFLFHLKNSSNITWSKAKAMLQRRFDFASQADVTPLAKGLFSFSLEENESFIVCLERFRRVILEAKVNYTDNVMLVYLFINCFPSKVQEKINETITNNFRTTNPSNFDNVTIHHTPANWAHFEQIISSHFSVIEEILSANKIQENHTKKRTNDVEELPFEYKVQKTSFVASGPSSSVASRQANFKTLRAQGICTYCTTVNFHENKDHVFTCEAKKAFFYKKRLYDAYPSSK